MAYQSIEVRKLTPKIGAEILGMISAGNWATSNSRRCTMLSWKTW